MFDFAVIVAVPAATAVTLPPDTAATLLLLVVHVTVLFVALDGVMVAVSVAVPFGPSVSAVLSSLMPVTATVGLTTVTLQVAVLPLLDFAVIVAVPAATAVTLPPDTVATLLLLVVHVTVLLVALDGVMVAVRDAVPFGFSVSAVLFSLMPVTATVGLTTVTLQVAVLPLLDFAVIVAVPAATAVTLPPDTAATLLSLVVHVTVLLVALDGVMVAVSVAVPFGFSVSAVLSSLMPVTATVGLTTVTLHVAALPLFDFAVIVAVPAATAVTLPPDTVATLLLLVVHVTVLFAALDGVIVAVSMSVLPFTNERVPLFKEMPVTATNFGMLSVFVAPQPVQQ